MKLITFKGIIFLRNLFFLWVLIFFTQACIKTPDESKLQKLKDASESHEIVISKELDNGMSKRKRKKEDSISMTTMNTGEKEPVWANKFPDECGNLFLWYVLEEGKI